MPRVLRFVTFAFAVVMALPAMVSAKPVSPLNNLTSSHVEIAMVGFTRESAEAFRTTAAAQTPDAATPAKPTTAKRETKSDARKVAAVTPHRERAAGAREHPAQPVVVRRGPNRWPRILRDRWAGPLERIHLWWNRHFDRRHFPYFDNPPKAA